jgi:hypothetical protein
MILPGLAVAVVWPSLVGLLVRRPASDLYEGFNTHESVEQTKVFLAKVQSQLNMLPRRDSQSGEAEMTMLSAALYRRAIDYPELSKVWITAAAVINRRSQHDAKTTTHVRCVCSSGE